MKIRLAPSFSLLYFRDLETIIKLKYELWAAPSTPIKTKIELTFARGLRSIVRQDPDIILVGEIRDQESAEFETFDSSQIKSEASREEMMRLRQHCIYKVLNRITTIEEVLRVTQK